MLIDYLSYPEQKGRSPHTVVSYRSDITRFFNDLNIQPDDYVIASDVRKLLYNLLPQREGMPLAITTINRRLNYAVHPVKWTIK